MPTLKINNRYAHTSLKRVSGIGYGAFNYGSVLALSGNCGYNSYTGHEERGPDNRRKKWF